jgi:acyl-homoserine lactone acylase PvdQ
MRIDERIRELTKDGKKPSTDQILAIQQDVTSLEAKELAKVLGEHCPKHVDGHPDDRVAAFCKAVKDFDGVYTVDATALPYARLSTEFARAVYRAHVDEKLAIELSGETFSVMALIDAVKAEAAGTPSPLLDDPQTDKREGLDAHRHLEDQYPLWHDGKPRKISLSKKDAEAAREGAMVIKPKG